MKRISLLLLLAVMAMSSISAQINVGKGQISGSVETNNIVYINDNGLNTPAPEGHFGSNTYVKVDYTYKRFSVGLQGEAFLPALQGYEIATPNNDAQFCLGSKYIQWNDKYFTVLAGDVYDQWGNGLIMRTYEDRQLGFNNALEGGRIEVRFNQYFSARGVYGRPRLYAMRSQASSGSRFYAEYLDDTWVGGADVAISLGDIFKLQNTMLTIEGSYVNRNASHLVPNVDLAAKGLTSRSMNMYSARLNFGYKTFTLRGEYVHKDKDLSLVSMEQARCGKAALAEVMFTYKTLSITGTARMLDNMGTLLTFKNQSTGNTLNYLPALTRQYTYMLANLNPYQVNVEGEIGAQGDIYYSLRSKSDRHRYWNFHVNYSTYFTLHKNQSISGERERLWQDLNFDIERQWNRRLKTTFLFSFQEWNPYHGARHRTYVSNIFVADVQYKFDRKKSLRVEAQYLLSDEYEGDWVAGLVEFNLAPHWSFYVSDMYNIDTTKKNYYAVGASYTLRRTRFQLSFGRNRAGYICSGGVCRFSPEYTGVNLMITSSF